MEDDFDLEMSPLCQSVTIDGRTLKIGIFKREDGKWIMEIEDEYGNSTVWDDLFDSDTAALSEAKNAIAEEGVASFVGPEDGKSGGQWQ